MTKSFDISRHVSADVGAFITPGVFGFGFDIEARWAGDHRGLDVSLRLLCFWIEASVYDIRHADALTT